MPSKVCFHFFQETHLYHLESLKVFIQWVKFPKKIFYSSQHELCKNMADEPNLWISNSINFCYRQTLRYWTFVFIFNLCFSIKYLYRADQSLLYRFPALALLRRPTFALTQIFTLSWNSRSNKNFVFVYLHFAFGTSSMRSVGATWSFGWKSLTPIYRGKTTDKTPPKAVCRSNVIAFVKAWQ